MLRSAQICKEIHYLRNLRTITQEEKRRLDKWPHFLYLLFELCLWYLFLHLKTVKIHFHGVLLSSILVCTIPEFWRRCQLWDQNFVSFDSGNIHIKESKKLGFTFFLSWEPNMSGLMVNFCLFQNAISYRVEARVFSPFFRMRFSLAATFFLYFCLSVWVKISILNFLVSF